MSIISWNHIKLKLEFLNIRPKPKHQLKSSGKTMTPPWKLFTTFQLRLSFCHNPSLANEDEIDGVD